ncbi:hotdog fold thioesterase [Frankia sp. AgB32]|uniref:hotdog fold thioesterase n=1 Tax=Frankia sp. AgB32 TaxID=631119 RepID=UPI00200F5097|nr:hotdog fold thioesterase [Frankia sp. AgB32]MCK9895392.1 hotdog fold thioesterase [Frankia sp. AgB32]
MTAADATPAADLPPAASRASDQRASDPPASDEPAADTPGAAAGTPTAGPTAGGGAVAPDPAAVQLAAQVNAARGEAERRLGILLTEASAARLVATMPVEGNRQPFGLLHGGVSVVLAETLGSVGAMLGAPPGSIAVGIEVSATHHRSATSGVVTGVATRVHGGRTLTTYDIRITDEAGRAVCTSRLTCMIIPAPPDAERP